MTGLDRRWLIAAAVVLVLVVPAVYAITFDVTYQTDTRFAATPNGPTIHFDEDRTLPSGNPFPASNSIHIQTAQGSAYYNGTANTQAQVDTINGTWSNVSELDVTAGNLTINPQSMSEAKIAGDADTFAFKGQAEVNDGQTDAIISATSGMAEVTLTTDGTTGTQYGLVDVDTNEGLAVDVANANGVTHFEGVALSTREVRVQDLGTLTLRNETSPHGLITGADVEVRFFSEDGDIIVERTDSDGDGEIDLTGLPTDESFIAQINTPRHVQCTVLIEDLGQQETAFCLPDGASPPPLEKEFRIDDQTGRYDGATTEIIIERAINQSKYDPGAGIAYLNVRGDEIGADRAYITKLQEDTRYRIRVRNKDGDVRQLGAFTPKAAGVTALEIGSVTVNQTQVRNVTFNATLADTASGKEVIVNYNDTRDLTNTLYIEVYERGNRSNTLITNTTFTGPLGEASVSQAVPNDENETTWMVRVTANRDGAGDFDALVPLSPRAPILPGLPDWLVAITSVGLIWVVAGLFSQVNGDIGAIVVAGLGGMLWFVDFVPSALGVGVVILAMVTAGLIFINERRDGGL